MSLALATLCELCLLAAFGYQAINVPQSVPIPSLGDGANKAASASSQAIYPAIPGLDHIQPFSSFASFSLPRGGPLPPPRASPYSFVQQQAGQSGHGNGLSQYTLSSRPQQPASSQTSASNSPVSTYAPSPSASTSFRFDSPNTSLDSHSSNSSTNSPNQSYDHYFYSAYQHIKPAPADDDDSWHGGLFDRTAASASPPAGTQHMSTHWQQNLSPQVAQSHGAAPDPMFRDQLFGWAAPSRTSLSPQPTSLPFRPTFQPQHNYTYPRAPHPQSMPQYMPSHASNQSQAANAYSVDQFINYSSSSAISPISQGRHDLGRRDLLNQALGVPTVGPAAQSEIKQNPKRKRGGSEVPQQSHSGQEVGSEQDAPGEDDPSFTTTGTGHHPDLASALKRQRTDPTSASLSPNLLQLEALKPAISSAIMGHVAVPFPGQGYSTDATPEQQAGQASTSAQPASQPDPVEVYIRVVPGECEGAAKTFACLAEGCEKRSYKTRNGIVQHVTNCHVNE